MILETLKIDSWDNVGKCPVRNVLDRVGDKWSMLVILTLGHYGTLRFNQLNQHIGNISQKMLTVTLKSLEADGLVARRMYPQIPPRVEYKLTAMGSTLLPALATLTQWANENMPAILDSRRQYKAMEV